MRTDPKNAESYAVHKKRRYEQNLFNARRDIASQRGDLTYRGAPCRHGHCGTRYTKSNECLKCAKARQRVLQAGRPKKVKAQPLIKPPYTAEQQAALEAGKGEKFYGVPCGKGHDGLRYLNGRACVQCLKEFARANTPPSGLDRKERRKWLHENRSKRRSDVRERREAAAAAILANLPQADGPRRRNAAKPDVDWTAFLLITVVLV